MHKVSICFLLYRMGYILFASSKDNQRDGSALQSLSGSVRRASIRDKLHSLAIFHTSPKLWSVCDTVHNVTIIITEETKMPEGSILQKIVQCHSICRSLAPCHPGSCHKCDKVKHNPIFHGWFDLIHMNHIKMQDSPRGIYIRGWL